MSISYSDTSTKKGLVQFYEKEIGADYGYVSGNTDRLKGFTASVNLATDDFLDLLLKSSGTWKPDDSNQTNFPEVTTPLVSSQRDYTFLTDETGNLILDIFRVYCRISATGEYQLLKPVDPDSQTDLNSFIDGQSKTGIPTRYDKTANGILLDLIPSYNSTEGLKISISREALYFVYTDTTKKPGFYGLYHRYFYLKPALDYARINNLPNYNKILDQVLLLENKIKDGASRRSRDERPAFSVKVENNK